MGFTVFREYTKDDSFTKLDIPNYVNECQVVLTSARDYNGINSTNGNFIPYWDTEKVTPQVISHFKDTHRRGPTVKVLVGIGSGSNKQFPFKIKGDKLAWVTNAAQSLIRIIKDYNLDGIDVHYENIESSAGPGGDFVHYIGQVIKTLREQRVITVASIAPDAATSDNFYLPLYKAYSSYIDTVVFQCFTGFTPDPTQVSSLIKKVQDLAQQYYPVQNFFLGYSAIKNDWDKVSPPLFIVAFFQLLVNHTVNGGSLKVTTDSITCFSPNWIIDVLTMASKVESSIQA